MTKREKITLIIALALLAAVLFLADNSSYNKKLIKDSNNIIKELHQKNKWYTNMIAALEDSIGRLQKKDTVIITRYKQKIDSVYVYNYNDYVVFYDTLLNTNLANVDTFLCFDSTNIAILTKKLLEGERDSLLLLNCNSKLANYDSIVSVQDSIITNKDIELKNINTTNSFKVKKLRKQRNGFIAATVVELAVIIGLISK